MVMKTLLALTLALGLAGCGADIAVRPSVGISVGPAYPAYYGGGDYYRPWHRWHRRGWY
jgi:hypothetical protein